MSVEKLGPFVKEGEDDKEDIVAPVTADGSIIFRPPQLLRVDLPLLLEFQPKFS